MRLLPTALVPLLLAACAATGTDTAPAPGGASDGVLAEAADTPLPDAAPMHPFLERLVGDWTLRSEIPDPTGGPAMVMTSVESSVAVGPWLVSRMVVEGQGTAFGARLSLAATPDGEGFHGTWIDSSSGFLWVYEGRLDEGGTVLTLEAEGPSFEDPTVTQRFRDEHELVDDDHKRLRSSVQLPDGSWFRFMEATGERVTGSGGHGAGAR